MGIVQTSIRAKFSLKFSTRITLATLLLSVAVVLPATWNSSVSSATSLTSCEFSPDQVFDVQWNITGSTLNVSGLDYPYDSNSNQQSAASYAAGDYFQFFPSSTVPGTYGLQLFSATHVAKSFVDNSGSVVALGTDFIFYNNDVGNGTLITTSQGYSLGDSAALPVTNATPTNTDLTNYTTCSAVPALAGASPSPSAAPAIPAPPQLGSITAISPDSAPVLTNTPVTISGLFPDTVSNISVDGKNLPPGSWTQTPTTVSFSLSSANIGPVSIQVYDGEIPILRSVNFTFVATAATPTSTPTPTPTISATPSPSATPTIAPVIPTSPVLPGNQYVLQDGNPVPATINPNSTSTGLVVDAGSWNLSLSGLNKDGTPSILNSAAQIVLELGGSVFTQGTGFAPNTPVQVYIFSDPTHIGTLQTNANGAFQGSLPIPQDLTIGNHMLQVDGISPDLTIRSATVGVLVASPASTAKPPVIAHQPKSSNVIPFELGRADIRSQQLRVLRLLKIPRQGHLVITGYASSTSGQDDIRISLDRALNVKDWLLKMYPQLDIMALGSGTTKNKACAASKNQCATVSVKH